MFWSLLAGHLTQKAAVLKAQTLNLQNPQTQSSTERRPSMSDALKATNQVTAPEKQEAVSALKSTMKKLFVLDVVLYFLAVVPIVSLFFSGGVKLGLGCCLLCGFGFLPEFVALVVHFKELEGWTLSEAEEKAARIFDDINFDLIISYLMAVAL